MRHFILSLIIAIGISACETNVELDVPVEAPKIVLNGILEVDSAIQVYLSESQYILDNRSNHSLPGAKVVLLEEGRAVAELSEVELEAFFGFSQALYRTDFRPVIGKEYTIQVDKAGFDPVEATTIIGTPVPMMDLQYDTVMMDTDIYLEESVISIQHTVLDEITLTLDDPEEENYYEIKVYEQLLILIDEYDEASGSFVAIDTIPSNFEPLNLRSSDPVVNDNDFIYGNDEYYGPSLQFSDELFNGNKYSIRFSTDNFRTTARALKNYKIILRSIDKEHYTYLSSVKLQNETEDNPFAEPVQVYNNIENGYGIFTGFSNDHREITLQP